MLAARQPSISEVSRGTGAMLSNSVSRSGNTSSAAAFSRALSSLCHISFQVCPPYLQPVFQATSQQCMQSSFSACAADGAALMQTSSLACTYTRPVDISEAELPQAVLAHLEEVREAQLTICAGFAAHFHQVRLQCSSKSCRPSSPICKITYTSFMIDMLWDASFRLTQKQLSMSASEVECLMPYQPELRFCDQGT